MRFASKGWYIISLLFATILPSCSGFDPLPDFQQNEGYEYKLFDILDNYPSLYSMVDSLEQYMVNDLLSEAVNRKTANYITSTNVRNDTIEDPAKPLQKSLQVVRNIVGRVIDQDNLDWDVEPTGYSENLFGLIDMIRDADLGIESDLVAILRAKSNYMVDNFDAAFHTLLTDEEIEDIDDPNTAIEMDLDQRNAAKTYLQCDYTLWLASDGKVRPAKESINTTTDTNLGVGNLVNGSIAKLFAASKIIKNKQVRDLLYEIIQEAGKLNTAKIAGQSRGMAEIMKDYLLITESYFTIGGKNYETITDTLTSGYNFKIYGGPVDPANSANAHIFSNAEARQISLSTNPASMCMMLRADRPGSLISPVNPMKKTTDADYLHPSNKHYLLDKLIVNLRNIGFDPYDSHLEESLYDLIRFDLHGRDRKNPSSNAWSVSFLESLLFLSGAAQNTGWVDGGDTSERSDGANDEHGHGNSWEILSFNDGLFSMGVQVTKALGCIESSIYDTAFPNTSGDRVFRSGKAFTFANRSNYRFYYDQNYSLQSFMSGPCAGEMGLPNGGNPNGSTPSLNEYRPFTADSFGDRNMARWTYYNIVRACWHGEGPYYYAPKNAATITANLDGSGAKLWYVYYRPNGLLYAYVHKADPNNPSSWVYLAPADGHDIEDADTSVIGDGRGRRQRTNRFQHTWYSDYYLVWYSNDGIKYDVRYVAPRNDGITNSVAIGNPVEPGRFVFHEILRPAQNHTRECASHIEAMYRNFVWAMNEKKFAVVIPLSLLATLNISGAGYKIVEANGTAGLTAARRYFQSESMNHVWIMRGDTGDGMGISDIPGDYRQSVFWQAGYSTLGITLDLTKVWTSTLWGSSTPPVVSHNAPAITRFAFPRFNLSRSVRFGGQNNQNITFSVTMGSGPSWFAANESDPNWNRRNGLLPAFVTLLGTLWDYQNRNFASGANRDLALKNFQRFAQNLVTMITPRFYYLRKNNSATNYMKGTWIPRIRGDSATASMPHHLKMHTDAWTVNGCASGNSSGGWDVTSVSNIIAYPEASFGGMAQRTFFQPEPMRTLINRLYDSDERDLTAEGSVDRRCDGLLALLSQYDVTRPRGSGNEPQTRILTDAFALLMVLAGEEFDDPADLDYTDENFDENFERWGARRLLFYALEQSAAGNRGTKGHIAQLIEEKPPFGIIFPSWMFVTGGSKDANGEYTSYSNVRVDEPVLDDELRVSIGYDDTWDPNNDPNFGIGLATIDEWDATDWDIFSKMIVMSGELMSDKGLTGGQYNITDNLISIIENFATKVTLSADQIRALVHTRGIVNAYYDGSWRYPDDMKKLSLEFAKRKLEIGRGRELESALFGRELFIGGGLVEYILETMDTPYTAEEIFNDLYRFLGDPLVANENSSLWSDLVEMSEGQITLIQRSMGLEPASLYEDVGLQYNGPIFYTGEIDYYGDLGRVLSR